MKIESKSLMLGDWVKSRTGMNVKIVGINHDYPSVYEPIPLTPKILEKNGFHTYDHTLLGSCIYRRMCGKYNEYEVVVRMLNGWIKIKSHDDRITDILFIDFQPRFVHQLQHALRLCGLNEMADNFIV